MFAVGAAFSLREGIDELIRPSATSSFAAAYVVLAISTVLDLVSIRQSAGQLARQARQNHREFLEQSRVTSEPSLRVVFAEDAVSIGGDAAAFAALAKNQITGSSIPRGVAAVLIALLMIRVCLRLIQRRHRLPGRRLDRDRPAGHRPRCYRVSPSHSSQLRGKSTCPCPQVTRRDRRPRAPVHLRRYQAGRIVGRVEHRRWPAQYQVKSLVRGVGSVWSGRERSAGSTSWPSGGAQAVNGCGS